MNALAQRTLRAFAHQDWIRYGIRERVLRRFCSPDTIDSSPFDVDFFGSHYRGNLNRFIDWCVYFYGAYDKSALFLLRDIATERGGTVFLDVGANVGQHSLFMSRYCEQVHAFEPFEPFEQVRVQLEQKILDNVRTNVAVHAVGLGSRDESLDYFAPVGRNIGTGSFLASHAIDNNVLLGKLRVVRGDTFLAGLGLDRVDLVKIDVEGFEKQVLLGLRETLRHHRPTVLMEMSETTKASLSGLDELRSLLPEAYTIRRVLWNPPIGVFFNRPDYHLVDFDFSATESADILFSPAESLSVSLAA